MINDLKIKILDKNGSLVFSSIEEKDGYLLENINTQSQSISDKDGNKVRVGFLRNNYGSVYAISKSQDHIKSSKIFTSKINAIAMALKLIIDTKNNLENSLNANTTRLLHNISSINAHNIQEIYSLVSQDSLAENIETQVDVFESYIKKNIRECALSFLRIAKNNFSIKNEFSVFNKLFTRNNLQMKKHTVHKVLMNSLYHFYSDFTEKSVKVRVIPSHLSACFDYECIHVVFYYILENSTKYILPKSTLTIEISDDDHFSVISFKMTSLQIKQEEKENIFDDKFSGSIPKQIGTAGKGIGLYLAKQIVLSNNGNIEVRITSDLEYHEDTPYQKNEFLIYLKENF